MSFIRLKADTQQYHVVIPRYKKLPPNPLIGGGPAALDRALAPPSETGTTNSELTPESRDDKNLRQHLLASDQRSFFTGSAAADLQAAHMLDPIRRNPQRKQRVEAYITQQNFHHPIRCSFTLDNIQNAILLEASLHVQWDLYGTFCFVPAEEDANAMLRELRASNEIWKRNQQAAFIFRGQTQRPLDISNPPFHRPHWEIVVLHPCALLPTGQPLAIAQDRPLYRRGQAEPPTTPTWKFWVASGDRLSLLGEPDEYLDPFLATDMRDEYHQPPPCSLAMVINAHCKLEQFLENHGAPASNRVKKFGQLMSELVAEIFFVPGDGYVNLAIAPSQPETAQASTMAVGEASDSTVENGFHGEVEAPEIPDADGLTDSEFRLVASRANDPHLNAKERADAAITMLFGTRRYANPYDHSSPSAQR